MQEYIWLTGMVLKQMPVGEYDRRICILTRERGKISAFARGARKQGSRLAACSSPFSFGLFKLYEGRDSYTVSEAEIQNYFEALRADYLGACYGMYFAEVADYYTRENNDEIPMLKLMYQSLRALSAPSLPDRLVKCIFEIKAILINGEYPGVPGSGTEKPYLPDTIYTMNYIASSSIEKLYTFNVSEPVLEQLEEIAGRLRERFCEGRFKSLEILKSLS